jgi:hypothetical protein
MSGEVMYPRGFCFAQSFAVNPQSYFLLSTFFAPVRDVNLTAIGGVAFGRFMTRG